MLYVARLFWCHSISIFLSVWSITCDVVQRSIWLSHARRRFVCLTCWVHLYALLFWFFGSHARSVGSISPFHFASSSSRRVEVTRRSPSWWLAIPTTVTRRSPLLPLVASCHSGLVAPPSRQLVGPHVCRAKLSRPFYLILSMVVCVGMHWFV
jgi:hypothetical protein